MKGKGNAQSFVLAVMGLVTALVLAACGGDEEPTPQPVAGSVQVAKAADQPAAAGDLVNVMVLLGQGDVMFTAYVPLKAHPLFYLGIILFAVGALVAVILFFATLVVAKVERRFAGSVPLVTYGLIAAAIIALFTLIEGALAFVPMLPARTTLGRSAGWVLLHTGATGLTALSLSLHPALGLPYLYIAIPATVHLLWRSCRLLIDPTPEQAKPLFMASNTYLTLILAAICIAAMLGVR